MIQQFHFWVSTKKIKNNNLNGFFLCQSCTAAIMKYHRLGGLTHSNLFLLVLEAGKSKKIKVLASFIPSDVSLPCLHTAAFSLCVQMSFLLCIERKRKIIYSLSLPRPKVLSDKDPILLILFNHNYILKTLSPNTITLKVKVSKYTFCG